MQPYALALKEHIQQLRPHMAPLSEAFYRRLFALAPEIEGVFRDDPTARLTKFANMLATLANLKGWEALQPALRTLGRRHREYGVKDHYYGFGKHALLETLQQPPWGPLDAATETAWRALLDGVIGLMLQGASAGRLPGDAAAALAADAERTAGALADPGLLEALGGYDAIYRIHLRFYQMMFEEPWLERFFLGKHETVLARKQTDFLVACLGGPQEYRGETPAIAHLHMFITEEMLDVRESLLRQAMAEAGVEAALQVRWLRIDNAFRAAVAKRSPDECVMRCVGQVPIVAKKPADYRPPG
jgi:hemoglobin